MNLVPNNFNVATLRLDLDCVMVDVKLGTRITSTPPSFLDLTDSESDIQTPASHSDGRAVKAHRRHTHLWGACKVANGNEQQVSLLMLTLILYTLITELTGLHYEIQNHRQQQMGTTSCDCLCGGVPQTAMMVVEVCLSESQRGLMIVSTLCI